MFRWLLTNNDTLDTFQLTRDPEGWKDINFVLNRSEKYDGIFLEFSQEVMFSCNGGGKEFIDEAYDLKGTEANIYIDIFYTCDDNETKIVQAKLNFASYKEEFRGAELFTIIDIEKRGISQLIKTRSETDIDLLATESLGGVTLNNYNFLNLLLHSKIIRFESEWDTDDHGCCLWIVTTGLKIFYVFPPFETSIADFERTNDQSNQCMISVTAPYLPNAPEIVNTVDSKIFIEPETATLTWNFSGQLTITTYNVSTQGTQDNCSGCNPQSDCGDVSFNSNCGTNGEASKLVDSIDIVLRLWYGEDIECAHDSGRYVDLVTIPTFALGSNPDTVNFSGSGSLPIPLNPNDKIWCYWSGDFNFASSNGDIKFEFQYNVSDLNITMDTTADETTCKALPIHESWSRVCEGVTDQTLAFKSEFFGRTNSQGISYPNNGYGSFTAITDGLRIRGFEKTTNAKVQEGQTQKGVITNIDDLYEACNTVWGVGLGIETHQGVEVVRVEEKDYFYSDNIILTLDDVGKFERSFAEELAFSSLELGYAKWKPQTKNGLDEPNTICKYSFPKIKSFDNEKILKSKFVASMYSIETTRRRHITFETSDDSSYDDDNFFIALKRDVNDLEQAEKNENITVLDGLIAPETAYNLRFNLFSCFDRVMNQFTTNLTKDQPQNIKYTYLEGNGSMQFQFNDGNPGDLNGNAVRNVQDTTYASGIHRRNGPIYLPELYKLEAPIEFSDYVTLLANPRGTVQFTSEGNQYSGFLKTLSYNIRTSIASLTLIRKYGS